LTCGLIYFRSAKANKFAFALDLFVYLPSSKLPDNFVIVLLLKKNSFKMKSNLRLLLSFVIPALSFFTSCDDPDEPEFKFTNDDININYYLSGEKDGEIGEYGWRWKCVEYGSDSQTVVAEHELSFSPLSEPIIVSDTTDPKSSTVQPKDRIIGYVSAFSTFYSQLTTTDIHKFYYSYVPDSNVFYFYKSVNNEVVADDFSIQEFDKINNDSFNLNEMVFTKETFKWGE